MSRKNTKVIVELNHYTHKKPFQQLLKTLQLPPLKIKNFDTIQEWVEQKHSVLLIIDSVQQFYDFLAYIEGIFHKDLPFDMNYLSIILFVENLNVSKFEKYDYFNLFVLDTTVDLSNALFAVEQWLGSKKIQKKETLSTSHFWGIKENQSIITPETKSPSESTPSPERVYNLRESIEMHLNKYLNNTSVQDMPRNLYDQILEQIEIPLIKNLLKKTNNNQVKTAEILGINRNTLRKKINYYKI